MSSLRSQARPLVSPAAAAERERQAEVGSREGACAPILQQPSKDKAERERECVRGEGACGGRELHQARQPGVTLETLGNWHLTLWRPGRQRRVTTQPPLTAARSPAGVCLPVRAAQGAASEPLILTRSAVR